MPKTALVVGATGSQGKPTALALLGAGWHVRVLTRDAGKAADLLEQGAEPRIADLRDPDALRAAASGVDAAYYHTPMGIAGPSGGAAEQTALQVLLENAAHVVVNVGFALPDSPIGVPMLDARVSAMQQLREQGATVLIPTAYMENLSAAWSRPAIARGELLYPRPAQDPIAWVTSDDVGTATVAALSNPAKARGTAYRLAGPDVLTFTQVADVLSDAVGHPVAFRQVTGAEYAAMVAPVLGTELANGIGMGYDQMPPFPNPLNAPDTTPARTELGIAFTSMKVWASRQNWTA